MTNEARERGGADMDIERIADGVAGTSPGIAERFHLIWVEGGFGEHEIDFASYPLTANRLYLVAPGQVHAWGDNNFQGRIFRFRDSLLASRTRAQLLFGSGFYGSERARPVVELAHRPGSDLITIANLLEGELHSDPVDWSVISHLLNAFVQVLGRTARAARGIADGFQEARMAVLLNLIEDHYVAERSVEFYASGIGLSTGRANQVTREFLGRTIIDLVHDRLVLEARRKLAVTDREVRDIGRDLGFDDPSYFTRFFRRETGQTPVAFRELRHGLPQPLLPFDRTG